MDSEMKSLLKSIREKTRIDVAVYSESSDYFVSSLDSDRVIKSQRTDFDEIFPDRNNGLTYFRFQFKGNNLIGYIAGVDEVERNYAYFIIAFLENSGKDNSYSKAEFLKIILENECSHQQIAYFVRKFSVSMSPCYVLALTVPPLKMNDVVSILDTYDSNGADTYTIIDENTCAFLKFLDGGVDELQSTGDFANILAQTIFEETGAEIKIGIGSSVSSIDKASVSFSQALEALKMSASTNSKSNVHSFKEYVWIKMIEDIPKMKQMEYLNILLEKDAQTILEDDDIIATVDEFLDSSLNVSETARNLFMHRNTLMYRLDKIERLTGLNIKNFPEAVTFRLITILNKLINGNK